MTIEEKIESALFGRVRTMALAGAPPIAWPNLAFDPPASAYIRVSLLPNRNTRLFLKGADPHFRQGILQLVVAAPLNGGSTFATALAGAIAEHFPADLALYESNVKVVIQAAPDVGEALKEDVAWTVMVSVRYETFA